MVDRGAVAIDSTRKMCFGILKQHYVEIAILVVNTNSRSEMDVKHNVGANNKTQLVT